MARTFIGELILRLKDEMSGKAKEAATNVDTSVERIQKAAERMNKTSWGGSFEEKLRKLGASSGEIDKLRSSWEGLNKSLASNDISKAMQAMEKSNFKTASLTYFGELASKVKEADTNIRSMHSGWRDAMKDMRGAAKDMLTYGTVGTLMYGSVDLVHKGIKSNAEYHREKERQRNANFSLADQAAIEKVAGQVNARYPSVGFVKAMEMARTARVMTGDTQRALEIMPDLAKAYVAILQSKGDAAPEQLQRLLRAIDDAGKNTPDAAGQKDIRQILDGIVKATQVEGNLLDPGDLWNFIRRAKNAGPGFSTDFLSATAPIFMQNMSASTAGTAMSSLYQNLQLGAAKKAALEEQSRIGIRIPDPKRPGEDMLKEGDLFGQNPYLWTKQVYIPALLEHGIDIANRQAVARESGSVASNPMGAFVLTQMVEQQRQIEKLLTQYGESKGLAAADTAAANDPFVSWAGFGESLSTFATAIKGMPQAIGILNSLTSGIERLAAALRNDSGLAQLGLAGAGAAGLFGAAKMLKGVWDLSTAGTSLQLAAASLEGAALSLKAGGAVDLLGDVPGKGNPARPKPWDLGWVTLLRRLGPYAAMLTLGGDSRSNSYNDSSDESRRKMRERARAEADFQNRYGVPSTLASIANRTGSPDDRDERSRLVNPYQVALDFMDRRQLMERETTPYNPNTPGLKDFFDQQKGQAPLTNPFEGIKLSGQVSNIVYELMKPTRDRLFAEVPVRHGPDVAHAYQQNADTRQAAGVSSNPQVRPDVDMSAASAAETEAARIGGSILQALSISAMPTINLAQLQQAVSLAQRFVSLMQSASGLAGSVKGVGPGSIGAEMRRNFADPGGAKL